MVAEQLQQEIRLAAAANACDDFNHTIMHPIDEPFQIDVAFDFHNASPC